MKELIVKASILMGVLLLGTHSFGQNPVNWTEQQLIAPADLANTLMAKKDLPEIINVGPSALIPSSTDIGMVNNDEGLQKLEAYLKPLDRDKKIIIYCGCCPYEHCPNVRPAINALKQMNFTNYYLLNLPHNIKKDWIDKNYPVADAKADSVEGRAKE